MNKGKIMIYGAGAIGRGFLASVFDELGYEIYFVDNDKKIIDEMKTRNSYKTAFSEHGKYRLVKVNYKKAFLLGEEDSLIDKVDFVFTCVCPNNVKFIAPKLKQAKNIICFENDYGSVELIKKMSGNNKCYFGVPDVISSNDCCSKLKKIDSLCLISEEGNIAIEKGDFEFPKPIELYSKKGLQRYWSCKFYLHNTPHAAAAFLGKLKNLTFLHESMQVYEIKKVVVSVMESMKNAMKIKKMADDDFIDYYAKKEIKRFEDVLLFDPISRVGREPLRKLRANDRLIVSAKLMQETGQDISGICLVIKATIFDTIKDYNYDLYQNFGSISEEKILKNISKIHEEDILFDKIINQTKILSLMEPIQVTCR